MKPLMCLIGASGSGKSTIVNELERRYGLKAIPSYTTRQPRTPDEKGHTFITEDEFDNLDNIIAYAETDSCRYAVTTDMLEDEQYSLYVVDLTGLKYLYENYHGDRTLVSAYIDVDVYERFNRMIDRKDDRTPLVKVKAALNRIEHDAIEFNKAEIAKNVGFIVYNPKDKFESAVKHVKRICDLYGITGEYDRVKE